MNVVVPHLDPLVRLDAVVAEVLLALGAPRVSDAVVVAGGAVVLALVAVVDVVAGEERVLDNLALRGGNLKGR